MGLGSFLRAIHRSRPVRDVCPHPSSDHQIQRNDLERFQEELRAELSTEMWDRHLQLQKAHDEWVLTTVDSLVRWAFREGVQAAQAMRANDGSTK